MCLPTPDENAQMGFARYKTASSKAISTVKKIFRPKGHNRHSQ